MASFVYFSGLYAFLLRYKLALLIEHAKIQRPRCFSNQHSEVLQSLPSAHFRDRLLTFGGFIPVCSMRHPAPSSGDQCASHMRRSFSFLFYSFCI
uniref:Putative secreted protein n=1 Tax=Ixodes ricinus TaxID=34613 RepID=A0A6B0UCW7_IXORI